LAESIAENRHVDSVNFGKLCLVEDGIERVCSIIGANSIKEVIFSGGSFALHNSKESTAIFEYLKRNSIASSITKIKLTSFIIDVTRAKLLTSIFSLNNRISCINLSSSSLVGRAFSAIMRSNTSIRELVLTLHIPKHFIVSPYNNYLGSLISEHPIFTLTMTKLQPFIKINIDPNLSFNIKQTLSKSLMYNTTIKEFILAGGTIKEQLAEELSYNGHIRKIRFNNTRFRRNSNLVISSILKRNRIIKHLALNKCFIRR
jgi:hypothetical protein